MQRTVSDWLVISVPITGDEGEKLPAASDSVTVMILPGGIVPPLTVKRTSILSPAQNAVSLKGVLMITEAALDASGMSKRIKYM